MKITLLLSCTLGLILASLGTSFSSFWARRCPSSTNSNCRTTPAPPANHHQRSSFLAARQSRSSSNSGVPQDSPWRQQPGESESAYMKRLQQMASSTQELVIQNNTKAIPESSDATAKKSGYMRVEEWNEKKYKKTNMTWEEKVQWDGRQHGDRFMQNEILRKNIKYGL
mmetsp:Transcript_24045/g.45696  ORF Transcript_24045/g.45696 Transcript_24045/m.45696 type:complete len:169 (-) Transcript_24045:96-602(-)